MSLSNQVVFNGGEWLTTNLSTNSETAHRLPDWVKCKVCGGKPLADNWLKPVNPDPACKVFIHMKGCIHKDA